MRYAIPSLELFCLNDNLDIQYCLEKFKDVPESLKEEFANNVYRFSLKTLFPIDENHEIFRYVDLKEEIEEKIDCIYGNVTKIDLCLNRDIPELKDTYKERNYETNIKYGWDNSLTESIDKKDFGVPNIKKYPMHDREHVLLAIKFFNYSKGTSYEKELAENINKKIIEYKITDKDIHIGDTNNFKKFYKPYKIESSTAGISPVISAPIGHCNKYLNKNDLVEKPKEVIYNENTRIQPTKTGFVRNGRWNSYIKLGKKYYRERVECLIYNKDGKFLFSLKDPNKPEIPGGSTERETTLEEQILNEIREEVFMEVKNLKYIKTYKEVYTYDNILPNGYFKYDGAINHLFIAEYDKENKDFVDLRDRDEIINYLGWYDTSEILEMNLNEHIKKLFKDNSILKEHTILLNEANNSNKRKQIEELIYNTMILLDKTEKNAKYYKDIFNKMTNEQFNKYMKKFLNDDDENFYLEILPNVNEPTFKQIKSAADYLDIPLDEYIYYRHDGNKDNPIRTPYKVPVVYFPIKRMQQVLSKGNAYSFDISKRNFKTYQLTGSDKISRISDMETYQLTAIGADYALKEFLSPRADNMDGKSSMYKDISMYGYSYLKDLPSSKGEALKTTNIFLLGAGLNNDL